MGNEILGISIFYEWPCIENMTFQKFYNCRPQHWHYNIYLIFYKNYLNNTGYFN